MFSQFGFRSSIGNGSIRQSWPVLLAIVYLFFHFKFQDFRGAVHHFSFELCSFSVFMFSSSSDFRIFPFSFLIPASSFVFPCLVRQLFYSPSAVDGAGACLSVFPLVGAVWAPLRFVCFGFLLVRASGRAWRLPLFIFSLSLSLSFSCRFTVSHVGCLWVATC